MVDGKNTKSLVVTDGANSVLVFDDSLVSDYSIGDYVEISGTVASYNEALQFTYTDVSISHVTDGSAAPTPADPTPLTSTVADTWATLSSFTTSDVKEYSWTATAGKSGTYTTLNLAGSSTVIEPVYVDSSAFSLTEGTSYDVTGYVTGYSSSHSYASIVLTSAAPSSSTSDSVTGVTVTPDSATIAVGATTQLTATVSGTGEFDDTVTWTSDSESVATVDSTGLVTGVAEGTATITATSVGDPSFTSSATITVSNEEVITAISDITDAGTYTIKGVIAASNSSEFIVSDGTAGIVVYASLDSSLAVGDYVKVSGEVTIFSKTLEFGNSSTVTKIEDETDKPTLPDPTTLTAEIADGWASLTTGSAFPTTGVQEYSWSAVAGEANNYVTLNIDGSSIAIEPGKTSDTFIDGITFEDGATYSVTAYLIKANSSYANVVLTSATKTADAPAAVTGVTVTPASATVAVGGTTTLTATVDGTGAYDDTVTWTSDNDAAATVDGGVVTGVAEGTATITATSVGDTSVSGSATITVTSGSDSDETNGTSVYDFSLGTAGTSTGALGTDDVLSYINGSLKSGSSIVNSVVSATKVYYATGNNTFNDIVGLKFGTGSATGELVLALSENITKVTIVASYWKKDTSEIDVNGVSNTIDGEEKTLVYDIDSSNTITIDSVDNTDPRAIISSIAFAF